MIVPLANAMASNFTRDYGWVFEDFAYFREGKEEKEEKKAEET